MNLLKSSRGTKFLAAGAAVAAIGMGTGGWAFAASSGHAPTLTPAGGHKVIKVVPAKPAPIRIRPSGHGRAPILTPVGGAPVKVVPAKPVPIRVHPAGGRSDDCSGLTLTPVSGAPVQPVPVIENPTPVPGTPVVCGDGGTTAG